ncbi:hypothetical protein ACFL6M_07080 [Candidatus Eisenbacteria bacterium]|uniref:DinB-like domain-containing protein n=1 Tax=Eiseniibacteriota bacterium TaxID=2212470 RepID=A0ABV6YLY0_UNCEI
MNSELATAFRRNNDANLVILRNIPKGAQPTKARLVTALKASEAAIARFLEEIERAQTVKGWNGPPAGFLGYLIAHEAHHRALAVLSLRLSGKKPARDVIYSVWNWGKKGAL